MKESRKPWTVAEEVVLRAEYPTKTARELTGYLHGRTANAIKDHAALMGLDKAGARYKAPTAPIAGRERNKAVDRFNLGKGVGAKGSLTDYLRLEATPSEKQAYLKATPPGSKAGTAPRTIAQLRKLL